MPELPEVQSVVNYLKPLLIQEKIHNITSPNGYEKVFDTHSISQINALANSLIINDVFRKGNSRHQDICFKIYVVNRKIKLLCSSSVLRKVPHFQLELHEVFFGWLWSHCRLIC